MNHFFDRQSTYMNEKTMGLLYDSSPIVFSLTFNRRTFEIPLSACDRT